MRTPTAGTKYQNEPIQASLQKVEQSSSFNDAEVNALPQTSPESSVMPLNPIDDGDVQIEDSTPLGAIVEGVEETHSLSPEDDERNREYLIVVLLLATIRLKMR